MKALIQNSKHFLSYNKFQPLCENQEKSFGRLLLSCWSWSLSLLLKQRTRLSAILGCLAGKVKLTIKESASNDRIFVGLVMIACTPACYWAYLFFDWNVVVPGWYYKNWFFWLFTNREEMTFGLGATGFFLICQQKWGYRYLLVPFVGLCFSEIVYQSFFISHWTHFYRPMWAPERSWELGIFIILFTFAAWKFIDYTVYRKFHLKDGNMARITGIIKAPGLTIEQRYELLEKMIEEQENFNGRI